MTGIETDRTDNEERGAPGTGGKWRPVLLVLLVVGLIVTARVFGLGEKLGALQDWLRGLGPAGPVVFILLYIAATVAAIPGSAVSIAAGALFGWAWGTLVVSIGATLGACLAFLIARYFARQAVADWLGKNEKFQKLDRLTAQHGAAVVALTRLVPIFPFNLLNYGFGLTAVPFWTYAFWSWLCMLPGIALYVGGADAVSRGLTEGRTPWGLVTGVAAVGLLLAVLVSLAKRRLGSPPEAEAQRKGGE